LDEINSKKKNTDRNALAFTIPGIWDKILTLKKCHLQEDPSTIGYYRLED